MIHEPPVCRLARGVRVTARNRTAEWLEIDVWVRRASKVTGGPDKELLREVVVGPRGIGGVVGSFEVVADRGLHLRQHPRQDAISVGILPKGTIVLRGDAGSIEPKDEANG